MLIDILVLILVVLLLCWIISLIPVPNGAPPYIKNVLYIILAVICIVWLLNVIGYVDLGIHRYRR